MDGIPVGAIRSDYTSLKVSEEDWCETFGHKIKQFSDGRFCGTCWKSEQQIKEMQSGKEKV